MRKDARDGGAQMIFLPAKAADTIAFGATPFDVAGLASGDPSSSPIDVSRPILPQLRDLLVSLLEAPYSAFVSNLLLVVLASILLAAVLVVRWITAHPDVVRLFIRGWRRRPRVRRAEHLVRQASAFLLRRFDVAGTYGLSFTITLAALLAGVWFFGSALEDVLAYNGTALFDLPMAHFLALHRMPWLTTAMQVISLLASGCAVGLIAIGAAIILWSRIRVWPRSIFLLAALGGAALLDPAIGLLVARPGPPAAWVAPQAPACGFEFGLTTFSVFCGLVAYLAADNQVRWRSRVLTWSGVVFIAFFVGVSGLYLGTDWLTGVLSRWALALLWLSAVFVVIALIERPERAAVTAEEPQPRAPGAEDVPPEPTLGADAAHPAVSADGLRESEVAERRRRGEVNALKEQASRTVAGILKSNIFTRFNALLGGLFVVILAISGRQDALFGLILIANAAIGVAQELRAKWTLDRLKVLVAPRARVVRDGVTSEVPLDQIVVDDVLELRPGDQVPVDGRLLAARDLEVNESLLTGEADPATKSLGDAVLSGSFVVAGSGRLQAVRIGEAAYSRRLAHAARQFSLSRSQLRDGINNILRYVTWALIPTAILLFITQILFSPAGPHDAAVSSIAGVVGMVPEGLVLLTSTVMAVAIVRLAARGALVQELAAVELLARVDVICADKTGTLTDGTITLEEIIPAAAPLEPGRPEVSAEVQGVLGAFAHDEASQTASSVAMRPQYPRPVGPDWQVVSSVAFSSSRKWSGLAFAAHGWWFLGAPEILLGRANDSSELLESVRALARQGKRVLALASSKEPLNAPIEASLPPVLTAEALVVLGEQVRADVATTIDYFAQQGIAVKVISGDHAETVQAVARAAGLPPGPEAIDARTLPTDATDLGMVVERNSLFGRVTPSQKRQMVRALQDRGHIVGMIGDGVNDVLAIKAADFGIALGSGTAASRAVAQLILTNNSFAALPSVVAEGRRVIANVERTANLFITKTIYVFALALAIGIAQAPFPFLPRHLTLVGFLTIGAPGLFLSLARNTTIAQPGFVARVLRFALPAGAIAAAATLLGYAAARSLVPDDVELARTAATLALIGCGFAILLLLARPRTTWQWAFLAIFPALLVVVVSVPRLRGFFALDLPPAPVWAIIALIVGAAAASMRMAVRSRRTDWQQGDEK